MTQSSLCACRTRLQWQHVITAFLAGILFAYAFLTLSLRIVHPSSGLGPGSQQESPWGPWAQSQAGRESFDKLIIAARHDDVRNSLRFLEMGWSKSTLQDMIFEGFSP